jgi:hypothetical protein
MGLGMGTLKSALMLGLSLIAVNSFAEENSMTVTPPPPTTTTVEATQADVTTTLKEPRWTIEGILQAQSVAGAASPWIGIGVDVHLLSSLSAGLRGFVPTSQTVDNSTYSIQTPVRLRVYHGTSTDFVLEGEYAVNFYNFIPFTSFGGAIGVTNRFKPGLNIGILGGIELAHVVIDSIGLEDRDTLIVYPKIALVADFGL